MTAYLVAGLVFGDEGKGSVVDAIARRVQSNLVVRYNGGHQAAHNVVLPDGTHHTFSQFGSASFISGMRTYLSKHVLVSPPDILKEAEDLSGKGCGTGIMKRMYVDENCLVVTPFARAVNRLLEMSRGNKKHGSTGLGIWQTREDYTNHGAAVLKVQDLKDPRLTMDKLLFHKELATKLVKDLCVPCTNEAHLELMTIYQNHAISWCMERYAWFVKDVNIVDSMPHPFRNPVFEGAQGALLDENRGFEYPHVTGTNTSFENAYEVLSDAYGCGTEVVRVGVVRTYFTRHGAGPFPSESAEIRFFEPHNTTGKYTDGFRRGYFDFNLLDRAVDIIPEIDCLAVNHLDCFGGNMIPTVGTLLNREVQWFDEKGFFEELEEITGAEVNIRGRGPTHMHKEFYGDICQSLL